jgi:hypothetical protein
MMRAELTALVALAAIAMPPQARARDTALRGRVPGSIR